MGIGLRTAQPPGVRGLPRGFDGDRRRPVDGLGQTRPIRYEEEHGDAAPGRDVPEPDRTQARTEPVGTARVVGFDDLRGKEQRPVVIPPAQQSALGIEPGVTHEALGRGARFGKDVVELLARVGDPLKAITPPGIVDFLAGRGQTDRVPTRPPHPGRQRGPKISPPRQGAQQGDGQTRCRQDQPLEPSLVTAGSLDEFENLLAPRGTPIDFENQSHGYLFTVGSGQYAVEREYDRVCLPWLRTASSQGLHPLPREPVFLQEQDEPAAHGGGPDL